ncbi:MAG: PD-(D/E)XK nuclease family protein [Erysipelotrichales bacterium]|nr:PD-(D/E)XK nuclease family protein [Erysipelotrichales bacterium]
MIEKLYIADTYLHTSLQKRFIKENQNRPICGIRMMDFSTFLAQYTSLTTSSIEAYAHMYHTFQDVKGNMFSPLLSNLSFIKEIYSLYETLQLNDTHYTELPSEKRSYQALRELFSLVEGVSTRGEAMREAYENICKQEDFSHVVFVNYMYKNTLEKKIYEEMLSKGAQVLNTSIVPSHVRYHFALNKRLECESIAQEIVELVNSGVSLEDIGIMVSDLKEYQDVLTFVMRRYNIPIYLPRSNVSSPVLDFLQVFFKYYAKSDISTFTALVNNAFLNIPNVDRLVSYIQTLHLAYEDLFIPFDHHSRIEGTELLSKDNVALLKVYEDSAKEAQQIYTTFLDTIDPTTCSTLLTTLHEYISSRKEELNEEEIELVNRLYQTFYPHISTLDTLPLSISTQLILDHLSNLSVHTEHYSHTITISDLTTPPLPVKYGFLVGVHQKTYPAFHSLSGLLNEELVEILPNFLPLSQRYDAHMHRVENAVRFADTLVISYPQSNYEGKTNEPSLELEGVFHIKEAVFFPVQENNDSYVRKYKLDRSLARDIFFRDGMIKGSISSFERFFKCPYSYFLKSGLKIKDLFSFDIASAQIGTLQHAFFEEMIKEKGKNYTTTLPEETQAFLDQKYQEYLDTYPREKISIETCKKQIKINLHKSLETLALIEEHTSFYPTLQEYRFSEDILTHRGIILHLNGIIDRVDEIPQGARVIDYKSSDRSFKREKFETGESLQLVTYAYIVSEVLRKNVFGIYYFSMRSKDTEQIASKVARPRYSKKLEQYEITTPTIEEIVETKNHNRLTGQTFVNSPSDLTMLDDTYGDWISDIKSGTKKEIAEGIVAKVSKPFDYEDAKEQLVMIYQYLIDSLFLADIDCKPVEGACTYCEYSSICMFRGEYSERDRIVNGEVE